MKGLVATVVILLASWEMVCAQKCPASCRRRMSRLSSRIRLLENSNGAPWELVFSAKTGTGEMVLDAWVADQDVNPGNFNADIFKSPLAEEWGDRPVDQVKIEVLSGGAVVAYFIFDGRGASKSTFMSKERLMASSNGNLVDNSFNIFGVFGDHGANRHFFINGNYGGCAADAGWLTLVDSGDPVACDWSTNNGDRPLFLYCEGAGPCKNDAALKGDTFQILLRFA